MGGLAKAHRRLRMRFQAVSVSEVGLATRRLNPPRCRDTRGLPRAVTTLPQRDCVASWVAAATSRAAIVFTPILQRFFQARLVSDCGRHHRSVQAPGPRAARRLQRMECHGRASFLGFPSRQVRLHSGIRASHRRTNGVVARDRLCTAVDCRVRASRGPHRVLVQPKPPLAQ